MNHNQTKMVPNDLLTITNLIYNRDAYNALERMAEMLCVNSKMMPLHLRNRRGDMMSVIMQASRWGLDPLMVAQCTYCVNNVIGYDTKLIQAILKCSDNIYFTGDYYGDWDPIFLHIRQTQKSDDLHELATCYPNDIGVGYCLTGHFSNGTKAKIDIPLISCWPRYAAEWKSNPQQGIHNIGVKRWCRLYTPHLAGWLKDYDDILAMSDGVLHDESSKAVSKAMQKSIETTFNTTINTLPTSKYEEIKNIIGCVMELGEIREAKRYIDTAFVNKNISQQEMVNLLTLVKTKEKELKPMGFSAPKK